MLLADYSLNYTAMLNAGEMDLFGFLSRCRQLGLDGASLHLNNLPDTSDAYLKRLRRALLDEGLALAMFTVSTNFGVPADRQQKELDKVREAVRVGMFLGAPILRVFAGSPPSEADREAAFQRAAASLRKSAEIGAEAGLPVGLQNHNHGALCRTGSETLRMIRLVSDPNFTLVLDVGQFAGSRGASAKVPESLVGASYMDSIRETAALARHVRVKFYNPRPDGSEPWLDYPEIFNILHSVHYDGFLTIVYEPGKEGEPGENIRTAMPRIVGYLRKMMSTDGYGPEARRVYLMSRYAGLEQGKFLETKPKPEAEVAFLEGPAWDGKSSIYFTNTAREQIFRWDYDAKALTVFRENSGAANGLLFDREGRLVACEGGAGRVTRTDMKTGKITVLADKYNGFALGSPNDLTEDAQGRIYFTSRLPNRDPQKGSVSAVYRIDAPGKIERILYWPNIDMPNGVCTSPDNKTLFLIDSAPGENEARRIRAYELKPDGTCGKERTVYDFYPGRSGDGMCIDEQSNLYVAAGLHNRRGTSETLDTRPGLHVISPDGKLMDFIETPEDTVTNCTFGGADLKTIFITSGKLLLSVRTRIPGKAAYKPGV